MNADPLPPKGTPDSPQVPRPGEFFKPAPGSFGQPGQQVMSIGDAEIDIRRVEARDFRLLQHVGYCDPTGEKTWVIARDLATWNLSLSSAPTLVNWIVPVRGSHFNAFVLHDALVEKAKFDPKQRFVLGDKYEGVDYYGPKVKREDADDITRETMKLLGTGFVRRWMAWAGTIVGTIFSPESLGGSSKPWRWGTLFALWLLAIASLGTLSTIGVLGWSFEVSGWSTELAIYDRPWLSRLAIGFAGAVLIPLALSAVWLRRWRFGVVGGLSLAFAGPAILVTAVTTGSAIAIERAVKWVRAKLAGSAGSAPSALQKPELAA